MKTTIKFVSVRRVLLSSLVMVIVLLLGRPVYAGIINFSFDGVIGVAGTVTGTIYGLLDDGAGQAATSITIDSAPWANGLWTPGFDVLTVMPFTMQNSFDMVSGNVVAANLWVEGFGQHFLLGTALGNLNDLWLGTSSTHTYNSDGFSGATYTAASIPEPVSIVLFGFGLAGLGWIRCKAA